MSNFQPLEVVGRGSEKQHKINLLGRMMVNTINSEILTIVVGYFYFYRSRAGVCCISRGPSYDSRSSFLGNLFLLHDVHCGPGQFGKYQF